MGKMHDLFDGSDHSLIPKASVVPVRKNGESELDYLRRKEIAFGLWQGDALERIGELERYLKEATADLDKYRLALIQLNGALEIAAKFAMMEAHEISADDFARDFAPFRNVMVHHGVEPYAKPKRGKKSPNASDKPTQPEA
jgi:hypothetical protein